jgi:HPt (histidine-containing phosphotransfer) domain-containing protein
MVTDLTYLNNMSGGAPEIIKEMIEIFIEQANEYIIDMQKLLEEKEYSQLGKLAHKAKSSISIMGMNELAVDLKTLEILANEQKEIERYPEFVKRFVTESKLAIAELTEIASKL